MSGIVHPYYAVALAPAIAALVGIARRGAVAGHGPTGRPRWRWPRWSPSPRCGRSSCWTATDSWLPWLRWAILAGGVLVATALLVGGARLGRWAAAAAVVVALAGTGAFSVATAAQTHAGSIPLSGPVSVGGRRHGGAGGLASDGAGGAAGATRTRRGRRRRPAARRRRTWSWRAGSRSSRSAAGAAATRRPRSPSSSDTSRTARSATTSRRRHGWRMGGDSEIAQWVAANYTATTVGEPTVYDLR